MAGERGGDLLGGGKAVGAGVGQAAVDAGEFSLGGVVGAGGETGLDIFGVIDQFRLRFGEQADRAGEDAGKWEGDVGVGCYCLAAGIEDPPVSEKLPLG